MCATIQNAHIQKYIFPELKMKLYTDEPKFYIFAPLLPDRLKAGLQILILTVLVRIQLGQLNLIRLRKGRIFVLIKKPNPV